MDNETLDCGNSLPTVDEFFAGLSFVHKWILVMPSGFFLMTLTLYLLNMYAIVRHERKETKSNVLMLVTLYPVSVAELFK